MACLAATACFSDAGPPQDASATTEPDASSTSGAETSDASDGATGSSDVTTATTGAETTGACEEVLCFPDADGDGVGLMTHTPESYCDSCPEGMSDVLADCDDDDPDAAPGLDELCDGIDNDCDGLRDEASPRNAACGGCLLLDSRLGPLWFCGQTLTWHDARVRCLDFAVGDAVVDLAVFTDLEEQLLVAELGPVEPITYWVGLADEIVEGDYGWVDRTPLDYEPWTAGEPNGGEEENCVSINLSDDGLLSDRACDQTVAFLCAAPTG